MAKRRRGKRRIGTAPGKYGKGFGGGPVAGAQMVKYESRAAARAATAAASAAKSAALAARKAGGGSMRKGSKRRAPREWLGPTEKTAAIAMTAAAGLGYAKASGIAAQAPKVPQLGLYGTYGLGLYVAGKVLRSGTLVKASLGPLCVFADKLGTQLAGGQSVSIDGDDEMDF